uniref:Endothelial differentiation related factor 1 n=1 Tax=Gallus gallus TaxID=9031 RepID=A0A8V1AIP8_CHICK
AQTYRRARRPVGGRQGPPRAQSAGGAAGSAGAAPRRGRGEQRRRRHGGERLGHGDGAAQEGPQRGPGQVQAGAAGQNKQHFITKNTAKLDRETEELHHDRVPLEVGKVIQQGRQSKGMTQKDLATKINEKPQVIADYESGRAIPNNQVMGKIERAIGLKLRGKDIGKPLETGPKGK